jgi:hypothetical protein
MKNQKTCRRKRSWPISKCYPRIHLEGVRKTKTPRLVSDRRLNRVPRGNKPEALLPDKLSRCRSSLFSPPHHLEHAQWLQLE